MTTDSVPVRPVLAFDRGTLVVSGAARSPGTPFAWDGRTGQWRCYARYYGAVRQALSGQVQDTLPQPRAMRWPRLNVPVITHRTRLPVKPVLEQLEFRRTRPRGF